MGVGSPCCSYCPRCSCGIRTRTFFCVLAGMPFGEPPSGKEARLRASRVGRGGVPPSNLAPPPGARGGERRADWGRAGRVELPAAQSSQCGPRFPVSAPAVRARRARPAMAAAAVPLRPGPGPLPLLLLPLLLLRAGPVRADSKVGASLRLRRRSAENWARGGAVAGGTSQALCRGREQRTRRAEMGLRRGRREAAGARASGEERVGEEALEMAGVLGNRSLRKGRWDPVHAGNVSTETPGQ